MSRRSQIMVAKSLYHMGVVTLAASVVWVSLAVYQAVVGPAEVAVEKELLEPLNPVIEAEALEALTVRRQFGEADWAGLEAVISQQELERGEEQAVEILVIDEAGQEEATESALAQP